MSIKLSKYITYSEAVRSEWASRNGVDNTPNPDQLTNIKLLCERVLDPIREYYGKPLIATSLFRCFAVNMRVGGSKTSHHLCNAGYAACDFEIAGISNQQVFDDIRSGKIAVKYDQLINEFPPEGWIHISYSSQAVNRGQNLIAHNLNGKTTYREVT